MSTGSATSARYGFYYAASRILGLVADTARVGSVVAELRSLCPASLCVGQDEDVRGPDGLLATTVISFSVPNFSWYTAPQVSQACSGTGCGRVSHWSIAPGAHSDRGLPGETRKKEICISSNLLNPRFVFKVTRF